MFIEINLNALDAKLSGTVLIRGDVFYIVDQKSWQDYNLLDLTGDTYQIHERFVRYLHRRPDEGFLFNFPKGFFRYVLKKNWDDEKERILEYPNLRVLLEDGRFLIGSEGVLKNHGGRILDKI